MSIHAQRRRAERAAHETPGLLRRLSVAQLADLLAPIRKSAYSGGSIVDLRWCHRCGEYMLEGSKALGCCVTCGSPRLLNASETGRRL